MPGHPWGEINCLGFPLMLMPPTKSQFKGLFQNKKTEEDAWTPEDNVLLEEA